MLDRSGKKLAWQGERMKLDSKRKSRRGKMMRSKSFETEEVRETGRKEARKLKGFPIL